MSLFLRLLEDEDKGFALEAAVQSVVKAEPDERVFEVESISFEQVPGAPFAYWVSEQIRKLFRSNPPLQFGDRVAVIGASTKDDGRFLRLWYEVPQIDRASLPPFAKGGAFSPFYADIHLCIRWRQDGAEAKQVVGDYRAAHGWSPHWKAELHNPKFYFRPSLTWPRRTQSGLALRAMPAGCIFADKGPAAFVVDDDPGALLAFLAVTNSAPFRTLVELQMAFGSYEVGVIQRTPVPDLPETDAECLALLARSSWAIKRDLDTAELTSHAFVLPALLRVDGTDLAARLGVWSVWLKETGQAFAKLQAEIDDRCFDLYGFADDDRPAAPGSAKKTSASSASLR